jgi:prepilin-type N-terminal cleavage/methylation domain-containing protein
MTLHKHESGFTLIELLVVVLIVGILGTLVAMTYSGVQAKNRNGERQADINTLKSQLETYYAQHSQYPTLANLNDVKWRTTNLKELKTEQVTDPSWSKDITACAAGDSVLVTAKQTQKCYSYGVSGTDSNVCDNDKATCAQYTLTATLEGGGTYIKSSLN